MSSTGYFLIADITGYTAYLNESELDHARGVLEGLLQSMIDGIETPFRLSNVQGDAIFCYAPSEAVFAGQGVVDSVERLYVGFRAALEDMVRNTTCPCKACSNIGSLDLKCILHFGAYAEQSVGGREELSGPEVIVAHRLMKNGVTEATGVRAYLFVTDAAAQASGLGDYFARATAHHEEIEHKGAVAGYVRDLAPVWEAWRAANPVRVSPDDPDLWFDETVTLPVAPATVWAYATDPTQRFRWVPKITGVKMEGTQSGRIGEDTVYRCVHGMQKTTLVVRDWRPFEYVTLDTPLPFGAMARTTCEFAPVEGGTSLRTLMFARPAETGAIARLLSRAFLGIMKKPVVAGFVAGGENMVKIAREDAGIEPASTA